MPNAPLRYVLAMARFPKIINIDRFVGAFQDEVRSEYPLPSDYASQGFEFNVGTDGGMAAEWKQVSEKFWQFSDAEQGHALILGTEFLVLHAGQRYAGHADFVERFGRAVDALLRVDGMAVLITALGYRYIDLIVPKSDCGESLTDFLAPWALPTAALEIPEGLNLIDSVCVAAFSTTEGRLRFQALRRPPSTLPPELDTPFVRQNGWIESRPSGEFALLDFDHAKVIAPAVAMRSDEVKDGLYALRTAIVDLFKTAITEHAIKVWSTQ